MRLTDQIAIQNMQGGPQFSRRRDGLSATRLATEVMHDRSDTRDALPRIFCFAIPDSPVQSLDFRDDHGLSRHLLRITGRQGASDLLKMFKPHSDMESCVDGPSGSRASKRILTGGRLRSCVRPVDAAHDRWPRWDPRSSPKQSSGFESHWFQRVLRIVGSTDTSSLSALTPWHRRAVQVVTG
jgi:hypothetical protein